MSRAGDCTKPLADWQLDLMIENERDRAWEELNAAPFSSEYLVKTLKKAVDSFDDADDFLLCAADEADGTGTGAKIEEIKSKLGGIWLDLKELLKEVS